MLTTTTQELEKQHLLDAKQVEKWLKKNEVTKLKNKKCFGYKFDKKSKASVREKQVKMEMAKNENVNIIEKGKVSFVDQFSISEHATIRYKERLSSFDLQKLQEKLPEIILKGKFLGRGNNNAQKYLYENNAYIFDKTGKLITLYPFKEKEVLQDSNEQYLMSFLHIKKFVDFNLKEAIFYEEPDALEIKELYDILLSCKNDIDFRKIVSDKIHSYMEKP